MYALYALTVPRERKLSKPTTVRLTPELQEWVKVLADARNDKRGQSGVISDALEAYRAQLELPRDVFFRMVQEGP